jgi:hypothetical protein
MFTAAKTAMKSLGPAALSMPSFRFHDLTGVLVVSQMRGDFHV